MQLLIRAETFDKNYLIPTINKEYENVLSLVFELFSKHHFLDRAAELYLYQLLKDTGYASVEDIPLPQLNTIVDYFLKHRNQYKVNYDEERLTYLLLAAIQSNKIILIIDNSMIIDLMNPISLEQDSTITFFKIEKLHSIKFKSI